MEAEYVSATHTAKELIWFCGLIGEKFLKLDKIQSYYSLMLFALTYTISWQL